jgi:acetyl esterase
VSPDSLGPAYGALADDQLRAFLGQSPPNANELQVAALREGLEKLAHTQSLGPRTCVTQLSVDGLAARLYRPDDGLKALVVYLHGGGWTVGNLSTHDRLCRRLAHGSGSTLLAIDYRLAPEHRWPASVDDTVATLLWVASGPDVLEAPQVVAVAGDSAGGTLAALACLRLRDAFAEALPDLQVLIYPNTDLTGSQPSMREKATGWGLDARTIRFFASQWVPDPALHRDPGVSPLFAPDLSGLPNALVVTAEHDPLRDEGEAYARRLRDAAVEVELRREPGLVHNFMMLDEISPACADAANRVAARLRSQIEALGPRRGAAKWP